GRRIRSVMRGAAQLMLFYGVYVLGFFRRFSERAETVSTGSLALPLGALVLGSAGVALGWNRLAPEVPWLRARLSLLLVLLVTTCVVALLIDVGVIPPGPAVSVFEFGTAGSDCSRPRGPWSGGDGRSWYGSRRPRDPPQAGRRMGWRSATVLRGLDSSRARAGGVRPVDPRESGAGRPAGPVARPVSQSRI